MTHGSPSRRAGVSAVHRAASGPAHAGDAAAAPPVPLFEGLGGITRTVTTSSPEAQRYFDQGLAFLYAFNHDEAIRSFRQRGASSTRTARWPGGASRSRTARTSTTRSCRRERAKAAWDALDARARGASRASPVERALIDALGTRYAMPAPADRAPLDRAYADAMRDGLEALPEGRRRRRAVRRSR